MNNQPITPQCLQVVSKYAVNEIFYTIQGEGPWQGLPATFIRLSGCNLRCFWCDTEYTRKQYLSKYDILSQVDQYPAPRVVLTGGEPFVQNITPLVHLLHEEGYDIQIETNGTLFLPDFPAHKVLLVCSPKAGKLHRRIEDFCRDYKFVVGAEDRDSPTGVPIRSTQSGGKRPPPVPKTPHQVWVTPRDDENRDANLEAAIYIAKKFDFRINLQIHKILKVR